MRQASHTIVVDTPGKSLIDVTAIVVRWVAAQQVATGLLTLWCRHTSASLTVQENASPAVRRDILSFFDRLAPELDGYEHDEEGSDDMPAHLRTLLSGTQLSIPVAKGIPVLGVWQGIYLFEHRRHPHRREIAAHLIGE